MCEPATGMLKTISFGVETMNMPSNETAKTRDVYVPKQIALHTDRFNNLSAMKRFYCSLFTTHTMASHFFPFFIVHAQWELLRL